MVTVVLTDMLVVVVAGVAHGSCSGPVVRVVHVPGRRKKNRLRMESIENNMQHPLSSPINL